MVKQTFKITIAAPAETVWKVLWNSDTYKEWTSVFSEGSTVETYWDIGSKVLFLDGKGMGLVSTIEDNKPNEFMSFKHLGMVVNGVEDYDSEAVKNWSGSLENYTLKSAEGKTDLTVDLDIDEPHKEYFLKVFPAALEKVKELAEKN